MNRPSMRVKADMLRAEEGFDMTGTPHLTCGKRDQLLLSYQHDAIAELKGYIQVVRTE